MKHIFFVISFVLAVFSKLQSRGMNLQAKFYNDIPMYAPLVISVNDSSDKIANAIATAFRKNVIVQSL